MLKGSYRKHSTCNLYGNFQLEGRRITILIELLKGIGLFYYWTWFIWPFVLIFSLAFGIKELIKNENSSSKPLLLAALALLVILSGLTASNF